MADYRIIALDLDGTLLNSQRVVTPRTLDLLLRLQEEGHKIVISTGRPIFGATKVAELLQLEKFGGYVMAYNGGVVQDWKTKEIIYSNFLQHDAIVSAYQYAKDTGFALVCYHDEFLVSEHEMNPYLEFSLKRNGLTFKQVDNFLKEVTYPISKCMIIGEPDSLHQLEERILDTHSTSFTVYRSEPFFLEVVPENINKATGLRVLLRHLNVPQSILIAFGDSYNDIPMIHFAGIGVAMGNAPQEVKDAADHIAPTNDEEGVAYELSNLSN